MLLSVFALSAMGQIKFGIKGGLSTTDIEPSQLLIMNSSDAQEFGLAVKNANYGAHLGLFTQIKIRKFFIQPEVLFNSNSVDYEIEDFEGSEIVTTIKQEKYQYLDIPLMMGLKFGPLRLQGGPVGHVFLNNSSELFDIEGYDDKFEKMTFGYQAGIGLDLWKLMLDFRYEGNFNKFGDHITFGGTQFNFDKTPARFVASVGISF